MCGGNPRCLLFASLRAAPIPIFVKGLPSHLQRLMGAQADKSLAHSQPCSKVHSPGRWTSECITRGTRSVTGLSPQPGVTLLPAVTGTPANITVKGTPCSY